MNGANIHCIFFDVGNVLLRVDHGKFGERLNRLTGLGFERLQQIFSNGIVREYGLGHLSDNEFLAGIGRKLGLPINSEEFQNAWNCVFDDTLLVPDYFLQSLARKYPLWAVSNTNPMHFKFVREHFGFLDCFQGWILSCDIGFEKPDPRIFQLAMDRAETAASEILFVDDLEENVEAARSLGIDAIQFSNFTQLKQEFLARRLL
jgi:glucose-1-phosphatase